MSCEEVKIKSLVGVLSLFLDSFLCLLVIRPPAKICIQDIFSLHKKLREVEEIGRLTADIILTGLHASTYYVRRSKDLKSRNWMIYLEGGWYCFDEATCISRQITNHALFSSRTWHMIRYIGGVLSWDDRINPNYHNYNTIFVPYCSSDLWTGKKRERTGGYYFHGSRILTAVIDDLLRHPEFTSADKVVFAGSSAGGIGVMLNIDRLARRLRRGLRYRRWQQSTRNYGRLQISGLVDSAWFLNHPTYAQAYSGSCTSIYDCPPEEGILRGIG
ncbi:Palmitoleoyl-protein carboxylesterase NOTUM [Taenia solium]|eukprot:TsM_000930800 transcript=TsM_000930800 gene=TsM_000930800